MSLSKAPSKAPRVIIKSWGIVTAIKKDSVNAIFQFKLFRVQTDDKSWFRRQILVPVWLGANFVELPQKFFSSHKQNKRGKQNTYLTLISTLKKSEAL